jgi:hypothetical protein
MYENHTQAEQVFAGGFGGAVSGFVCAPMELTMIQQQRFGTSLGGTIAKIVAETGVLGMFRGLLMSCGREGLFSAGMVNTHENMKTYIFDQKKH